MKGVTGRLNRDRRAREIAMIKVGVKQLGLDDAAYRAMLFTLTGQRSAAKLDQAGRTKVIESLKRDGAYAVVVRSTQSRDDAFARAWAEIKARVPEFRKPGPAYNPGGVVVADYDDHKALYLAAWHWLGTRGHLWSDQWEAAAETTFVMRTAHVAHLRFCTPAQTNKLIEAVKSMVRRAVEKVDRHV